jgi:hypothetical protein
MPVDKFGYSGGNTTQTASQHTQSLSGLVKKSGDTMLGDLNLNNHTIHNSSDPISPQDLVNKRYVDLTTEDLSTKLKSTITASTGIIDNRLTADLGILRSNLNTEISAVNSRVTTIAGDFTQSLSDHTTTIASNTASVNNLISTKLDKSGGVVTGDLALNGDLILSRPLNMRTSKITNVGMPTLPTDAVNKEYSDLNLLVSGGIMSGDISMDNIHTVTHLPEPTALHHAATKRYVDTVVSDTVRTALSAAQSAADQTTATKSYVDDAEEALSERIEELQRQVAALAQAVERRP